MCFEFCQKFYYNDYKIKFLKKTFLNKISITENIVYF